MAGALRSPIAKLSLYFVSSPYSDPKLEVKAERKNQTTMAVNALLKQGVYAITPLEKLEAVSYGGLPDNFDFWGKYSLGLLEKCDGMIVLRLPGWDQSTGVKAEIAYAQSRRIPVVHANLEDLINRDSLFYANWHQFFKISEGNSLFRNELNRENDHA
jgi:hypothetical protein